MGRGRDTALTPRWAYPAALLITLSLPIGVAVASCVSPAEREAKMVRHVQTELMVGALQCRGSRDAGQRALYDRFVTRHRTALREQADVLRAYFERRHGKASKAALDSHVTGLANRISSASRSVDDFCQRIADYAKDVVGEAPARLAEAALRAPVPYVADEPLCRVGTAVNAAPKPPGR